MRRDAVVALALLCLAWAATLWLAPWSDERINDLSVYRAFTVPLLEGGLPYRDVFLEYPPLAAPAIGLPGLLGTGEEGFRLAFAGWTLLLAATVVVLCGMVADRTGGDRRRAMLAAALAPFACGALVRTHFDLAPVALLLAALLLLCLDRPRAGMALLGLAVMTKGFPLVVAPVALAWLGRAGRVRDAVQGAIVLAAVMATIAALAVAASPDGALGAVRYQLGRPIQIESTPASVLVALDGLGAGEARLVGSHRSDGLVHEAGDAVAALFACLLFGVLALLVARMARVPHDPRHFALASLAAVAAFAALGKVLSPQFLIWVIPLGALALAWRMHLLAAAVAAAAVLTQVEFPARYLQVVELRPSALALVALRNAALLAAVVLALRALATALERGREQQLLDRGRAAAAVRLH